MLFFCKKKVADIEVRALQQSTATEHCNRAMQQSNATEHCNRALQQSTATAFLQDTPPQLIGSDCLKKRNVALTACSVARKKKVLL